MLIKTVIFDFDGTLASSLGGIHACFREALLRHGYAGPSLEDVRQTVGMTLDESVRMLTKEPCDGARMTEVLDSYRALYKEKGRAMATLFPGAQEALTAIRSMGLRIVLVSNKSQTAMVFTMPDMSTYVTIPPGERASHHGSGDDMTRRPRASDDEMGGGDAGGEVVEAGRVRPVLLREPLGPGRRAVRDRDLAGPPPETASR